MQKIVLASVLKPSNDVRMHDKLAMSLANIFPKANIYCLGNKHNTKIKTKLQRVMCLSIYQNSRRSLIRLFVGWKLLFFLMRHRPDMLVICCIELLWVGTLFKLLQPKTYLVYDVQENYQANVKHTQSYASWLRPFFLCYVKTTEALFTFNTDVFWLAESCYLDELSFLSKKQCLVLLNKFKPDGDLISDKIHDPKGPISFLLMGTLGKSYGTLRAMTFVKHLKASLSIKIDIIGYCADQGLHRQLTNYRDWDFVHFHNELDQPVPHAQIIQLLYHTDIVLMPYIPNQSYQRRIPSKFYECLALGKSMIIHHNPYWEAFLKYIPKCSVIFIDFEKMPSDELIRWCQVQKETPKSSKPDIQYTWQTEDAKLKSFFEKKVKK